MHKLLHWVSYLLHHIYCSLFPTRQSLHHLLYFTYAGGNFDKRVSATLLFGNGNSYLGPLSWKLSCLDNVNLLLPKERRRSIISSKDEIFGLTEAGVIEQQIETSGYDCGNNLHCFIKLPKGCEYGQDEQHCEATQRFYSASSCPACNSKSGKACPSNASLSVNECPISKVPDEYIGGDETIEGK